MQLKPTINIKPSMKKDGNDSRFYCGDISIYSEDWFYNRNFVCGNSIINFFEKFLNLSEDNMYVLDRINWRKNYFEINLLNRYDKKIFKIALKQYKKDEQWLYKNYQSIVLKNKFIILFKTDIPKRYKRCTENILSNLSKNLNKIKTNDLFRIAYNDNNKLIEKSRKINSLNKDSKTSVNSYYDWGNKNMGQTFMLTYNLIDQIPWVNFDKTGLLLRCGDIECNNIYHPFYFFTYFSQTFNTYKGGSRRKKEEDKNLKRKDLFKKIILASAVFELKDNDIILGCDSKIKDILGKISQNKNIPLQVISTCIGKIIGSDIDSFIKKINIKNNARILYEHNLGQQPLKEGENLIMDILKKEKNTKKEGKIINLIGFEDDYAIKEILKMLKNIFGIKLNEILLPEINPASLKKFYKANLHVLNNLEVYDKIFNNLFGKLDINTIKLPAPYGISQTLKWIKSIANFFKIPITENKKWKEYYNEKILEWNKLIKEADKFRLGLIISDKNIESLIKSEKYPFGIPILKCLEEMGFGLNILFTTQNNFDSQKNAILNLLKNKEKHKIELLNNPNKLEDWISATDCKCIYSDFRNDKRILSNGKTAFSLFIFQKGFDGAIQTLEELLNLCKIILPSGYKKSGEIQLRPIIIE